MMAVTILDRSWLDAPQTLRLIAVLNAREIPFRFVGGAVRDALLGRKATDVDLATPALPQAVIDALTAAGLKSIPTGIAHGTVTALVKGRHFEITTLRRDVETDGRHAVVAFTDDWREDAARRDFTMNALYAGPAGIVTDYFGGIDDARSGRIRFIGDPELRIREDALRILRFFRFHAHYGQGPLDPAGLAACSRLAPIVDGLSAERVRDEIFKTLRAPDPCLVWRAMIDAGVMAHVIPEAMRIDALSRMVALESALYLPPDPLRRLAAVTGGCSTLKERLKLSNLDAERLASLASYTNRIASVANGRFGQALYGAEPGWVRDAAMLSHIDSQRPDREKLIEFLAFLETWTQPRFPLSGADLSAAGIAPGPEMGRLLDAIEDWWVESGFEPDRAACLARLASLTGAL